MSSMIDEMIQDRVENGELVKGARGSIRIPAEKTYPPIEELEHLQEERLVRVKPVRGMKGDRRMTGDRVLEGLEREQTSVVA